MSECPRHWLELTLEEVLLDARSGFASGENIADGVIQIRMNNVTTDGRFDWSKVRRVPVPAKGLNGLAALPGDVLFNQTNSPELVGKAAVFTGHDEPVTYSNHFLRLRPRSEVLDGKFLVRWIGLQWQRRRFEGLCRQWVNQATVSREQLLALKIPLPPLPEQRRIAAILDAADSLRAKRRAALAKLDQLAQSIFIEMFGQENKNGGDDTLPLTDFFEFRTGKLDSNAAIPDGRYPFFTCSRDNFSIDEYAFDCKALLLAGNNASADYSVKYYDGKFNAYQRTYVLNLIDSRNSYIYAKIALQRKLNELKYASKGTNTKYLTMEIFRRMRILSPSPSLQKLFELRILSVEALESVHRSALRSSEALFASLQHRAFRGDL